VTVLFWIQSKDSASNGLAFGTTAGYIGLWKQSGKGASLRFTEIDTRQLFGNSLASLTDTEGTKYESHEVVSFSYNDNTRQLICLLFSGHLHTFNLALDLTLENKWSFMLTRYAPMAVTFEMPISPTSEIWVLGTGDLM
jgi:hypothetical protein